MNEWCETNPITLDYLQPKEICFAGRLETLNDFNLLKVEKLERFDLWKVGDLTSSWLRRPEPIAGKVFWRPRK